MRIGSQPPRIGNAFDVLEATVVWLQVKMHRQVVGLLELHPKLLWDSSCLACKCLNVICCLYLKLFTHLQDAALTGEEEPFFRSMLKL